MPAPQTIAGVAYEGSSPRLMARLVVEDGGDERPAEQADIASITFKVFDGCVQVGDDDEWDVGDVVYDELQTGSLWDVDDEGFNVKATLDGEYLPAGDRTYRVEAEFTLANDEVVAAVWEITTVGLAGR